LMIDVFACDWPFSMSDPDIVYNIYIN